MLGDNSVYWRARTPFVDTGATEDMPVTAIAIGHQPNTEIFQGQLEMKDGYIVTKSGLSGMATMTRSGRVAAGDVQDHVYSSSHHQRWHGLHGRPGRNGG